MAIRPAHFAAVCPTTTTMERFAAAAAARKCTRCSPAYRSRILANGPIAFFLDRCRTRTAPARQQTDENEFILSMCHVARENVR